MLRNNDVALASSPKAVVARTGPNVGDSSPWLHRDGGAAAKNLGQELLSPLAQHRQQFRPEWQALS